ncbi:choice-of-anchor Q domain-containing protein [Pontiellaceae bacterium B12227]|nr:choice-of-anchor Q domain-containing protein [Pontiellaceae bacterium B12227]
MKSLIALLALTAVGAQADTHYVDMNNLTPSSPYTSWATSATNIQNAVDVATTGDSVLVADGLYELSNRILITKGIAVESVNGSEYATVDGKGITRCFYLYDTSITLSGFKITNGSDYNGGGIYCSGTTPVISNCVIMGNISKASTSYRYGEGGGVYSGTVVDSVISGNRAKKTLINTGGQGGGTYKSILHNCTITDNFAEMSGGGVSLGSASNCDISSNRATVNGGGAYYTDLDSCYISGNRSSDNGGGAWNSDAINCIIVNNYSSDYGGGMSSGTARNCTIVGNSAGWSSGGTHSVFCYNSIIYHNVPDNVYGAAAYNTCSPDLIAGVSGNTTNEPQFISADDNMFRLSAASPCRDAGRNSYAETSTEDYESNPRIYNAIVDIGAYEYNAQAYDSDSDGMMDDWEILYFENTSIATALSDTDGDLQYDLAEYIFDTNPKDPASLFTITSEIPITTIEWACVAGRWYNVLWTPSLTNSFQLILDFIDYPQNSFTDIVHNTEVAGFYKIEARMK